MFQIAKGCLLVPGHVIFPTFITPKSHSDRSLRKLRVWIRYTHSSEEAADPGQTPGTPADDTATDALVASQLQAPPPKRTLLPPLRSSFWSSSSSSRLLFSRKAGATAATRAAFVDRSSAWIVEG